MSEPTYSPEGVLTYCAHCPEDLHFVALVWPTQANECIQFRIYKKEATQNAETLLGHADLNISQWTTLTNYITKGLEDRAVEVKRRTEERK